VTASVVDAAIAVHRALGPGLLESAYEGALSIELRARGHDLGVQVRVAAEYRGRPLEGAYRLDLVVDDCVVVELKAVDRVLDVHVAQVLTYLRLTGHRVGLLLNFNVRLMRDGIRRVVV